eukprot:gene32107-36909_t
MKIDPAMLYTPRTTIRSFSETISERLKEGGDEAHDLLSDLATSGSPEMEDFDNILLTNINLYQGLRGCFTVMVLWDHFHYPYATSIAIEADTFLFLIISGFTTSLQTRIPPRLQLVEDETAATGARRMKCTVKDREMFGWKNFVITRLVGIFPILWLALISYAPYWYLQDTTDDTTNAQNHSPGLTQNPKDAGCTFLYIVGLNIWNESQ